MLKPAKLTPMLKQFLEVKKKHPDKLILFRMGDFYETFYEDAKQASKILGITLTARNKKADNPVPLAGFPYHALDHYLDKLVKKGLKIVICEQVEDPRKAKGLVKRDIVDIITPGSIIDGRLIDKAANNFLVSITSVQDKQNFGMAAIDASTGDFLCTTVSQAQLENELSRLQPSEIVLKNDNLKKQLEKLHLDINPTLTIYENWYHDLEESSEFLKKHFSVTTLEGFGIAGNSLAISAAAVALSYIQSLKNQNLRHVNQIRYYSLEKCLRIDDTTRRNLELMRSLRYNDRHGSLISILDKTQTPMGIRKLNEWLLYPLVDPAEIYSRSTAVESFFTDMVSTKELRSLLNSIGDVSRIISKIGTKRVNPRDLTTLKDYLKTAPTLTEILNQFDNNLINSQNDRINDYSHVIKIIEDALVEESPLSITEGNIIRDNYNELLDELRNISRNGKSWIARLEEYERQKTGISSLKVSYNRVFGYYIEVTKTHKDKIPDYYIRKQTLVNAERYISPQLKEYEAKVLGAEERIKNLEYDLFQKIRDILYDEVERLQQFADVIGLLDVLSNLAYIAYHNNYVKPVFNSESLLEIKNCRHPVIEKLLTTEEFIPNDVYLNNSDIRIALITGPNMAGKSTYLRQIGILSIMAQMGGFVPASSANLPIFDQVFTRVGASDNLAMGQSTFLVEMIETANILNSATPDSLVLLDEIGRGTSTFDGLSIAWAIVEYIHNTSEISCKTLFATHYHELTELESILPAVKNFNILVQEWNDKVIFLRKIERGTADQSYGIHVAKLAGVPVKIITRAKQILRNLEEHELSPQGLSAQAKKVLAGNQSQMDIFDAIFVKAEEKNEILEQIKQIDINNITPLEAIQKIEELQKKL